MTTPPTNDFTTPPARLAHPFRLTARSKRGLRQVVNRALQSLAPALAFACVAWIASALPPAARAAESALRDSLTFYAPFDAGTDAVLGEGNLELQHASGPPREAKLAARGLPPGESVELAPGQGRFRDALRFKSKSSQVVFYEAARNITYRRQNWSGTVSLWLKVEPKTDLAPGFCDPIQITPRDWNDAAFFVEFEKKPDLIPFRLGAYADFKTWNPQDRKWEAIPFEEKPLVSVLQPPFAGTRWTHVVFTWERYNTGLRDGLTRLYLDGELVALISPREQTFSWDLDKTRIQLGVSYVGLYDELALFDRALSEAEVRELHGLKSGVTSLLRSRRTR